MTTGRERALAEAERLEAESDRLFGECAYARAAPPAERALSLREGALGPGHADLAGAVRRLARLRKECGEFDEAERLYLRAIPLYEEALGEGHVDVADVRRELARMYRHQGVAPKKAEALLLDACERAKGADDRGALLMLDELGDLYCSYLAYEKAESVMLRALGIREGSAGPGRGEVWLSLGNLARLCALREDFVEGSRLYERAIEALEGAGGGESARQAAALATFYQALGDDDRAEAHHRRALAIAERQGGPAHPEVSLRLFELAAHFTPREELEQAESLLLRAVAIDEQAPADGGPSRHQAAEALADLYEAQGANDKAEALLLRALASDENRLGVEHLDVARRLIRLSDHYVKVDGGYSRAEPLLRRAIAILEAARGPEHPDLLSPLRSVAAALREREARDEAEAVLLRVLAITEKVYGPDDKRVAAGLVELALSSLMAGAPEKAFAFGERALACSERAFSPESPDVAELLVGLSELYAELGRRERAEAYAARALTIYESEFGPDAPETENAREHLAQVYRAAEARARPTGSPGEGGPN